MIEAGETGGILDIICSWPLYRKSGQVRAAVKSPDLPVSWSVWRSDCGRPAEVGSADLLNLFIGWALPALPPS
jgi:hypothetical protein